MKGIVTAVIRARTRTRIEYDGDANGTIQIRGVHKHHVPLLIVELWYGEMGFDECPINERVQAFLSLEEATQLARELREAIANAEKNKDKTSFNALFRRR